jgi:hypothetical protein
MVHVQKIDSIYYLIYNICDNIIFDDNYIIILVLSKKILRYVHYPRNIQCFIQNDHLSGFP